MEYNLPDFARKIIIQRKTSAKLVVSRGPRLRKYVARKFNLVKLMTLHGKRVSKLTKVQPNQSSPAIIPPALLFPSFPLFLSTRTVHTHFICFTILYSPRLLRVPNSPTGQVLEARPDLPVLVDVDDWTRLTWVVQSGLDWSQTSLYKRSHES